MHKHREANSKKDDFFFFFPKYTDLLGHSAKIAMFSHGPSSHGLVSH